MILWVLYDIEKDRSRTKVAKLCQQAGLHRVQYSCFLGEVGANQKDELELRVEELINEDKDKVYMFPMSKNELEETICLGQALDKDLVAGRIKELFF